MSRCSALLASGQAVAILVSCTSTEILSARRGDGVPAEASTGILNADAAGRGDVGSSDAPGDARRGVPSETLPVRPSNGWCWENPLPQGNSLAAVQGSAPD